MLYIILEYPVILIIQFLLNLTIFLLLTLLYFKIIFLFPFFLFLFNLLVTQNLGEAFWLQFTLENSVNLSFSENRIIQFCVN